MLKCHNFAPYYTYMQVNLYINVENFKLDMHLDKASERVVGEEIWAFPILSSTYHTDCDKFTIF